MIRISLCIALSLVINASYCFGNKIVTGEEGRDPIVSDPTIHSNEAGLTDTHVEIDVEAGKSDRSIANESIGLPFKFEASGQHQLEQTKSIGTGGKKRVKRCGPPPDDDDDDDASRSRRARRRARRRKARKARKRAAKRAKKTTTTTVTRQVIQDGQVVSQTVGQVAQPVASCSQQGVAQVQQPVIIQQTPAIHTVQQPLQGSQLSHSTQPAAVSQAVPQPQVVPQQVVATQQAPAQQPDANAVAVSTSFSAQGAVKV